MTYLDSNSPEVYVDIKYYFGHMMPIEVKKAVKKMNLKKESSIHFHYNLYIEDIDELKDPENWHIVNNWLNNNGIDHRKCGFCIIDTSNLDVCYHRY